MDIGVFIPINNNGWLISATSPQYMPSFELNKRVVQMAEGYGLVSVAYDSLVVAEGFAAALSAARDAP